MRITAAGFQRLGLFVIALAAFPSSAGAAGRLSLDDGWQLRSSAGLGADGKTLSTPGYATTGWHRAAVPGTVVGMALQGPRIRKGASGFGSKVSS